MPNTKYSRQCNSPVWGGSEFNRDVRGRPNMAQTDSGPCSSYSYEETLMEPYEDLPGARFATSETPGERGGRGQGVHGKVF